MNVAEEKISLTQYFPYLCSVCSGKVCYNRGPLNVATCQCECAMGYKGDTCETSEFLLLLLLAKFLSSSYLFNPIHKGRTGTISTLYVCLSVRVSVCLCVSIKHVARASTKSIGQISLKF